MTARTNPIYNHADPLRVVTLFSGYDSQCMALDRLKQEFPPFDYTLEAWCEIDKYAIHAHNAVYPQWADRNLGDISQVNWDEVRKNIKGCDLLTYSFPCTNLSICGKQEGFEKGSGTASSLLWYCEDAIKELRPRFLLMENVKPLVSKKFLPLFNQWQTLLEGYGYSNFWQVLNAKNYNVPQNRDRVFMVSIHDRHADFHFPQPMELQRRLGDVWEQGQVDEVFYLNETQVERIVTHCWRKQQEGCGFKTNFQTKRGISGAIKTKEGSREYDTYLIEEIEDNEQPI